MKVTKRQLRQIIREERAKLQEAFGVDQFYDFVDAVRAGIGYIADWDVARQWEGMFGVAPRGQELATILDKLEQLGMLRDEDEDMMEAKGTVRVTEAQLRRIVREAAGALNEEEYDYYRDYKAGTISREQYEDLVDRFQGGRGPDGNRDKLKPSDFAITTHKPPKEYHEARKAIEAAMKADGLTNAWRDYSEMRTYLEKGYKDHPDYDGDLVWDGGKYVGGQWDSAAHDMLRSLERSMD